MNPAIGLNAVNEARSLKDQILLTSPQRGNDPIRSLFRKQKYTPHNFPFDITQLKFRHGKIMRSLDVRMESKAMISGNNSDRCPSIDSEAYVIHKPDFAKQSAL